MDQKVIVIIIFICSLIISSISLLYNKLVATRKYPPAELIRVAYDVGNITNAPYGNGNYNVASSSTDDLSVLLGKGWKSRDYYDPISGNYKTSDNKVTIKDNNGNNITISGEYIIITLPTSIILNNYTIYPGTDVIQYTSQSPKEFVLVGGNKNDASSLTILDDKRGSNAVPDWTSNSKTFNIDNSNKKSFDTYSLIICKVGNNNVTSNRNIAMIKKIEFYEKI